MKKITAAIAGLGSRGRETYARYVQEFSDKIEITAIADIDKARLDESAAALSVPPERCFTDAAQMLEKERLADIMFVCTPDADHYKTSIDAMRKGYHLLLEKPVATTAQECIKISKVANELERHVIVCHVLRYAPFYGKIKELIKSGAIGKAVTINALEGVGYYHHAHSFVRGKWADTKASSPMILAKCCHDIDIILWLMDKHIKSVSSFGSLLYFRPENAPKGSAKRCTDCGIKDTCEYNAEKIYITNQISGINHGHTAWPADVLAKPATEESIRNAISKGDYGRCVFHCDNDAVDHQMVNMQFMDGTTASLTMTAFTAEIYRTVNITGTLGEIEGDMRTNIVKVTVFGQKPQIFDMSGTEGELGGHGGGDAVMFDALVELLTGGTHTSLTSIDNSVESHLACFAAERSRLNGGMPENI